jgi:hypothetical protein
MKRTHSIIGAAMLATALFQSPAVAQSHEEPHLHVNPRWKECSFQLAPTLTQSAWHQFTREAGLVTYFRPLADARPMGKGNFDVSVVQWETGIDDSEPAWNDTFVHPDSTHWLLEGEGLKFPGLMLRGGLTSTTDVGVYLTKAPGANYGFYGAQVQRSLVSSRSRKWAAAARVSFISMYGPEDLNFSVYGADLLASRTIALTRWAAVSPYAGVSTYLASSHEKSSVVDLSDERVLGGQAMVGAALQLSKARLALEYNAASVRTVSLRMGIGRS